MHSGLIWNIVLTCVVIVCFALAKQAIDTAPWPIEPVIKWLIFVIAVIITVALILQIWGLGIA